MEYKEEIYEEKGELKKGRICLDSEYSYPCWGSRGDRHKKVKNKNQEKKRETKFGLEENKGEWNQEKDHVHYPNEHMIR